MSWSSSSTPQGARSAVVRIFIDQPAGISVDDCERVSREVAALLDVDDPIPTAYTLEVSSPGFDRVLRTPAHFERFVGERVFVELQVPRAGTPAVHGDAEVGGRGGDRVGSG